MGVRGAPPKDVDALANLVVRFSELALSGDAQDMELNPVRVYERGKGCLVLDVRGTAMSPTKQL
jgi:acyl-CoA synthetase (NDP forming)